MANQVKIQNNQPGRPPALEDYLSINLLWWGFMVILALIGFFICGAVLDDVTWGVMEFIFAILGGGFTLVSALDYTYEKYLSNSQGEAKR